MTHLAGMTFICCLCFEAKSVDELWIDGTGIHWNVCVPCHDEEALWIERLQQQDDLGVEP